jgi:mannose/fructose/N-acetylgalactosamine-specific phosphotransferase system component IID
MFNLPVDPRDWPNQAPFWQSLAFFLLWIYALVSLLGDYIFTCFGLGAGDVERNPLNKLLFKKWGQAVTSAVDIFGVLVIGGLLAILIGIPAALIFFGTIGVGETYISIKNYLLLKKQKVSLK